MWAARVSVRTAGTSTGSNGHDKLGAVSLRCVCVEHGDWCGVSRLDSCVSSGFCEPRRAGHKRAARHARLPRLYRTVRMPHDIHEGQLNAGGLASPDRSRSDLQIGSPEELFAWSHLKVRSTPQRPPLTSIHAQIASPIASTTETFVRGPVYWSAQSPA